MKTDQDVNTTKVDRWPKYACVACGHLFNEPETHSICYQEYPGAKMAWDHIEVCPICHSSRIKEEEQE